REVEMIALAAGVLLGGNNFVDLLSGKPTVVGEGPHREVHIATRGVCMSALDQPLYEFDHLRDMPRCPRLDRRWQATERVVGGLEGTLVRSRPFPPRAAGFGCLRQDLVVDVGDVANQQDIESVVRQPPAQYVVVHARAEMADVRL